MNTALLGVAATAVAIIAYAGFPQSAAFAIQSQLKGSPDGPFALSLGQPAPRTEAPVVANRYRQLVALPIVVTGANPVDLRIQSVELTFRTLSGVRRRVHAQVEVVDGQLRHIASLDRTFFDAAKDSPVHLEAEWYLTQYGNARSAEVPLDGTPVYISGPGQCGVVAGYTQRRFVCRSAFRSPQPFQSDQVMPWDRTARIDWLRRRPCGQRRCWFANRSPTSATRWALRTSGWPTSPSARLVIASVRASTFDGLSR